MILVFIILIFIAIPAFVGGVIGYVIAIAQMEGRVHANSFTSGYHHGYLEAKEEVENRVARERFLSAAHESQARQN